MREQIRRSHLDGPVPVRGFISLLWCLLFVIRSGNAVTPQPAWVNANLPRRAAFSIAEKEIETRLVKIPLDPELVGFLDGAGLVCDAYSGSKKNLPFRVVSAAETGFYVLVGVSELNSKEEGFVYFGPPDAGEKPLQTLSLLDPQPVRAMFRRVGAKGVPDSWEKTLYMYHQAAHSVKSTSLAGFGEIGSSREKDSDAARAKRLLLGSHIIVLETYVLCPRSGVYHWGLRCSNSGFVFVDDERVIDWPGEHVYGEWSRSAPQVLAAGVHKVTIYNVNALYPTIDLGWQLPGTEALVPVPPSQLVSSTCEEHPRVERVDRSVHPAFDATVGASYGFREHPAVFVPMQLESATRNWLTNSMSMSWFADGVLMASGERADVVLEGASRHSVRLDVRDALGFETGVEREVDCRLATPKRYAVAADLVGLKALCYAYDRIEPYVRLRGELPETIELDIAWSLDGTADEPITGSKRSTVYKDDVRFSMGIHHVRDLSSIEWTASHHGVSVDAGRIQFVTPPFRKLPARVEGDALYDDEGTRLVLVPFREAKAYSQRGLRVFSPGDALTIYCLDDMLAVPGLPLGARHAPFHQQLARSLVRERPVNVRYVPLPGWESNPRAYGPYLKLALLSEQIGGRGGDHRIVVFSVGLQEMLRVGDPAEFERRAAAMSDLAAATLRCPVVWVTPPPYYPDPARVRPYATAVRKVAAARDMPVADVYTAFLGADGGAGLYFERKGLALSDHGQRLAARVIERALKRLLEE